MRRGESEFVPERAIRFPLRMLRFLPVLALLTLTSLAADPRPPTPLWPQTAPGEKGDYGPEVDITKPTDNQVGGRRLIRLGNVSQPTLTVYSPDKDKDTGAAVIVCPGGGYGILALDLEGTEVCEWLNSIGVTGILLKYRVPKRPGLEKHTAALQDAQRAVGVVRSQAKELGLDPKRIGILGFSAGGHLAATASNNYETRTYPKIDAADDVSSRPDFTLLIYPAYLTLKDQNDKIAPELPITAQTPPTFIVMTQDDGIRVETAMFYSLALKNAKVPCELHVYPSGGHGYGLRPSEQTVTTWPARAADWLGKLGVLKKP
jgi:acetyl esterase/lipase